MSHMAPVNAPLLFPYVFFPVIHCRGIDLILAKFYSTVEPFIKPQYCQSPIYSWNSHFRLQSRLRLVLRISWITLENPTFLSSIMLHINVLGLNEPARTSKTLFSPHSKNRTTHKESNLVYNC